MKRSLRFFVISIVLIPLWVQAQVNDIQAMRKAAEAGDTLSMLKLSEVYALGIETKAQPDSVLYFLKPLAVAGHSEACFLLGNMYLRGSGVNKNIAEGIRLLEYSASRHNLQACRVLCEVYSGKDINTPFADPALVAQKNDKKLFRIASLAEKIEDPVLAWYLGICYLDGFGTPKQDSLALYWLMYSEKWNYGKAQLVLGDINFFNRMNTGYDILLAEKYYKKLQENVTASLEDRGMGLEGIMWVRRSFNILHNQIINTTFLWGDWQFELPVPKVKKKDFERKRYLPE